MRLHSTQHELSFIDDLGRQSMVRSIPILTLLRSYRSACEKRTDWGDVDRCVVFAKVDMLIAREESRNARRPPDRRVA